MEDRDENGRLRLPREDFIPFQRVLHRPNRSTHKRSPEDVTSSLGRLTLHRRKERSGSLPEKRPNFRRNVADVGGGQGGGDGGGGGGSNVDKASFVPFQRVLHRRRKTSLPQPSPLPEPRRYRDRLSWEHQRPHAVPFDPHYSNKHYYGDEAARRRRQHRHKNDSHLNHLLGNHRAREEEQHENGEVEGVGGGAESPSGGGNAHSDGGSDAASIASSIKLPQIHGSPPAAPESARSGRTSALATASSSALTTRLQPLDS